MCLALRVFPGHCRAHPLLQLLCGALATEHHVVPVYEEIQQQEEDERPYVQLFQVFLLIEAGDGHVRAQQ
eukprot:4170296-Heterocapsa_arctica.AAC.1